MTRAPALILALILLPLAGCISPADDVAPTSSADTPAVESMPVFGAPLVVDPVRAGGEPVIAILPTGTILTSSHPGWTHYHNRDPSHVPAEILTPTNAQSYLWRSTDGGATWTHIGLPGFEQGPRSTGFGVSDPEFTVMADGTVCYTDLEGLAMSSVSCSTDDGVTWMGNPVASQRPNDRQWLASYGNELYFTANFFTDHALLVSTDLGITWERRGDTLCSGDLIANPRTGTLYAGCGNGVSVSTDGGRSFERRLANDAETARGMTEPGIDSADTMWMAYATRDERTLTLISTMDDGVAWSERDLTTDVLASLGVESHAFIWPWLSAGSAGRLAVTWIGADLSVPSGRAPADTPWYLYTAFITGADTATPSVTIVRLTPEAIHVGPICQSGTTCQVDSMQGDPSGDRRLGDFFETAIDAEGFLHAVVSTTTSAKADVISHVLYVRQTEGPRLLVDGDTATQG